MDQENALNAMAHTNAKDAMEKDTFTHKVRFGNSKHVLNVEELAHAKLVIFQDEGLSSVEPLQVYIHSKSI